MPVKGSPASKSIIACITLTYVLSWAWLAILIPHGGYKGLGWVGPFVFMWMPGLCSIACRLLFREGFRDIGWRWRNWKATMAAIWAPLVVGISVYALLWGTGLASMHQGTWGVSFGGSTSAQQAGNMPFHLVLIVLLIMTPIVSPFSLGEELGWRGYLLDRMVKSGMRRPVFILGVVWAVWHLPVLLSGQYLKTSNMALTVLFFILMILASNSVICRLRLQSGGIWIPVLMHSIHNVFFQNILQPMTVENRWHTFLGGECGILTALAYGILAWMMWRDRKTL